MLNRTPFYGGALFTALFQSVFGTLAGFVNGQSRYLYIFGKLAGGLSIATWLWITVLLRFNRRNDSTFFLCRAYTHFASFAAFSTVWLAVGIMLASQMPAECSAKTLWCAASSFSTALAFCTSFFSMGAAYLVFTAAKGSGAGLTVNVAQVDKAHLEADYSYGPDS